MPRLSRIGPNQQMIPVDIVAPGRRGLNTIQAGELIDTAFCATANNAIIDVNGRIAARLGFATQTTTPIANVTVTNEVDGTGNGSATMFQWATVNAPVIPNSVTVIAGAVTGTDNGTGTISGAGITSGTINYSTGQVIITFTAAVGNGTNITTTYQYTPQVRTLFQYQSGPGAFQQICAWNGGVSNSIINPGAHSIAGTAAVTNGRWWFQNFNGKMVGFIAGQKPAVYSVGTPQLNTIVESAGTWPLSSGVGAAAFGRVWSVSQSDGQTITYSGLLNETDVGTDAAGVINVASIWSDGTDTITAIFAFNSALVVCGTRHIIMFTDGRGSQIGMDPTQAYVFDVITGTGVLSQWTVDHIGQTDVVFLGPNGVQSLLRLQNANNNPAITLTKYVRDDLLGKMQGEVLNNITGVFIPQTGYYTLSLPLSATVYCLDMRRPYTDEDGEQVAVVTTWSATLTAQAAMYVGLNSVLTSLFVARSAGNVALYAGNTDEGAQYTFNYTSPWMDFTKQAGVAVGSRFKLLKMFRGIVYSGGGVTINLVWNTDFANTPVSASVTLGAAGTNSQYGIGQYGIAQYGGSTALSYIQYDARAKGQYYQIGVNAVVNNIFALQQIQLACKLGRMAGGQSIN